MPLPVLSFHTPPNKEQPASTIEIHPITASTSSTPLMACLDAALLLHILSFAMGNEALTHWRGQSRDCALCPLTEGDDITYITTKASELRRTCRLVCKYWCRVMAGPFLRSFGLKVRSSNNKKLSSSVSASASLPSTETETDATISPPPAPPSRAFSSTLNGPTLFSGVRNVTLAVTLSMLLDPLEPWHRELQAMAPHAGSSNNNNPHEKNGGGGGVVSVRLNVETAADSKMEVLSLLSRAAAHEGDEEVEEEEGTDEEGEGDQLLLPTGAPAAAGLIDADANLEEDDEEEEDEHLHIDNGGGTMGGLQAGGAAIFGHGAGNEAEEDAVDAIALDPQLPLPMPLTLPILPPPKAGFVLREISLSNLTSSGGGGESVGGLGGHHYQHFINSNNPTTAAAAAAAATAAAVGPFVLRDDMVHLLLRTMPPTVERLSLARNPHLYRPLAPLASPVAPRLKEIVLDGCWRVDMYALRTIGSLRGQSTKGGFYCDLIDECFGNGRGISGGARPCGMKEVVILNGKYRGEWVRCVVIHKAGPSRYHIKVCPTSEFDNAIGFSGRAALDIARKNLRHYCGRKVL